VLSIVGNQNVALISGFSPMSRISWDIATPDGRVSRSEALLPTPVDADRFLTRATQRTYIGSHCGVLKLVLSSTSQRITAVR
jgi:hypothetical protein